MPIHLYLLPENQRPTTTILQTQDQFDLLANTGVFFHLSDMWQEIYDQTGMEISDTDDAFYQGKQLATFLALVQHELDVSKSIPLDQWTFNLQTTYHKLVDDKKYTPALYDSTRAYLAEHFMKSYKYELKSAQQANLHISVAKHWLEVKKADLLDYLAYLQESAASALAQNKRLYFRYS